jgi:hypothetical protein
MPGVGKVVMSDLQKYLEILELAPGASWDEVTQAYRELIKIWHPDRFGHDEKLRVRAEDKSKLLNEAVRQLRRHYRKTQLIRRSDWVAPEAASRSSTVDRGGTWSACETASGVRHDMPPKKQKVTQSRCWDPEAEILRRHRQLSRTHRIGAFMAVSSVGLCLALIGTVGYPGGVQMATSALTSMIAPRPGRDLSDYRFVATTTTTVVKKEKETRQQQPLAVKRPWTPDSKPPLVALAADCNVSQLTRIVEKGADLEVTDKNGDTALAWAARTNCISAAKVLLEHGANPKSVARNGFTPKDWARWAKNYRLLSLLQKRSS